MTTNTPFSELREIVKYRSAWSERLSRIARTLAILSVLAALALVVGAWISGASLMPRLIVAVVTSVIAAPLYIIADAIIRSARKA